MKLYLSTAETPYRWKLGATIDKTIYMECAEEGCESEDLVFFIHTGERLTFESLCYKELPDKLIKALVYCADHKPDLEPEP